MKELTEKVKFIETNTSHKRPEENYKFVFKRCIDHMKEVYHKKKKSDKRRDADFLFYSHYFGEISRETHIPLECFYDPRKTSNKQSQVPKTINSNYVKNILRGEEFMSEFNNFMNHRLLPLNIESLDVKINTLVTKWRKQLEEARNVDSSVKEICLDIRKNKKGKLPWTAKEVEEGIKSVQALFTQVESL